MSDLYINNITETNLRRLKITQREHYLHYSKEFTSNQIATELIAPSPGKQIMIKSMSCSADATTGEAWLHYLGLSADTPLQKGYFSKYSHICNPTMAIKLPVDKPLLLTTTTNTDKFFISLNYIEV